MILTLGGPSDPAVGVLNFVPLLPDSRFGNKLISCEK
jgi:hypothetical protein